MQLSIACTVTEVDDRTAAPEVALILAAGRGSRLNSRSNIPKPLTKVLGLTLAERVVHTLRAANISRFIVALGHEAETIKAHFSDIAQRRGVTIEFVEARDWELGNGASTLAAKGRTGDAPFFLVMTDHLFDPAIALALASDAPASGEMCLAVDRDKAGIFDLDDVTRVQTANGRITGIDKSLREWDAVDTGVMLCTTGLFEGLERAAAKDRHGLSDGLRELAREGRARTVDVTGQPWIDVDTSEALCEGERRLIRGQGSKTSDGPVSRYLNRPVSRWLTRYLVDTAVTPNQISVASWLVSCVAAGLFAAGGYPALAAGGVLAQLASIIDGCDGEIARLKESQSEFGGWFDAILDRYADAFLLFGLTWHQFSSDGSPLALVIGFAAILGSFMNSYSADKYDGLMARKLRGASYFRLGRDVRVFIVFLGAVFNLPLLTLSVIALVMNIEVVRRIIVCRHEHVD
jgi:CDP-L-myo-inositol myo-inositolphosphotransferase